MEQLTTNDLDRIFIRTQDEQSSRWLSLSVKEATDQQFDTWAKSRMPIQGDDTPWSMEERADFCNRLYQQGALSILKEDAREELGL